MNASNNARKRALVSAMVLEVIVFFAAQSDPSMPSSGMELASNSPLFLKALVHVPGALLLCYGLWPKSWPGRAGYYVYALGAKVLRNDFRPGK